MKHLYNSLTISILDMSGYWYVDPHRIFLFIISIKFLFVFRVCLPAHTTHWHEDGGFQLLLSNFSITPFITRDVTSRQPLRLPQPPPPFITLTPTPIRNSTHIIRQLHTSTGIVRIPTPINVLNGCLVRKWGHATIPVRLGQVLVRPSDVLPRVLPLHDNRCSEASRR